MTNHVPLDELLAEVFSVPEADLQRAMSYQHRYGGRLEQILVNLGSLADDRLIDVLAHVTDLPLAPADILDSESTQQAISAFESAFPEQAKVLLRCCWVPVGRDQERWHFVTSDPFQLEANEALQPIGPHSASLIPEAVISSFVQQLVDASADYSGVSGSEEERLMELANEAPVVNLFNSLVSKGMRLGASDLHLEPYDGSLRVRYRIDGVLQESERLPLRMQMPLTVRIKILAGMDIAERRRPQDGKIAMRIRNEDLDLRVSSLPLAEGESLVLRFLQQESVSLAMSDMGFSEDIQKQLSADVEKTAGVILLTGPTGSGKTTTLYTLLSLLNSPTVKIITLEDPVEYQLEGINQVHVNSEIGFDFAAGLRSVVRQDPDVIMVGEIRDRETAQIALQSALTGHLVFSTLHTNDSASAYTRLLDLGVEEFLLNAALISVVAQRLVRRLCPACAREHPDGESIVLRYHLVDLLGGVAQPCVRQAVGCEECGHTGYRGRLVITEYLGSDDVVKALPKDARFIGAAKTHNAAIGRRSLMQDGFYKVAQGLTTVEEVVRVAG